MAKQAVAKKADNLPATNDTLDALAQFSGSGMETVGAQDVSIPRFKILQDLSPEVNKRKAEYLEGAEPGMILNTATRELHSEILVLPCVYRRHHIEWMPDRGGFVADHGEDDSLLSQARQDEKRNFILPNGNLIVPTGTWYVLSLTDDGQQAVIPMSRTQLNPSKTWMNMATSEKVNHPTRGKFVPPLFYRAYTLKTVVRDKGENSWFVWSPVRGPTIMELSGKDPQLMPSAIKFTQLVKAGEVRTDASTFSDDAAPQEDENAPM
jgi:hypothetical protein